MGVWSMTWFLTSVGGFVVGAGAELIGTPAMVARRRARGHGVRRRAVRWSRRSCASMPELGRPGAARRVGGGQLSVPGARSSDRERDE